LEIPDPHQVRTLGRTDDMPGHIKMAQKRTIETVPFAKRVPAIV